VRYQPCDWNALALPIHEEKVWRVVMLNRARDWMVAGFLVLPGGNFGWAHSQITVSKFAHSFGVKRIADVVADFRRTVEWLGRSDPPWMLINEVAFVILGYLSTPIKPIHLFEA
jgi:hypothetical protein